MEDEESNGQCGCFLYLVLFGEGAVGFERFELFLGCWFDP